MGEVVSDRRFNGSMAGVLITIPSADASNPVRPDDIKATPPINTTSAQMKNASKMMRNVLVFAFFTCVPWFIREW